VSGGALALLNQSPRDFEGQKGAHAVPEERIRPVKQWLEHTGHGGDSRVQVEKWRLP
jgi:hypothetical protein